MASQGEINRITVIGILNQISEKCKSVDGVFILSNEGSNEIIISGKEKVTLQEKAVLSAKGTKKRCVAIQGSGKIRFESIEISGANTNVDGAGIAGPYNSLVTLGNQVKIVGNKTSGYGGGIYARGKWIIEDGASIIGNKANFGGGVYIPYAWNEFILKGGIINNNKANISGGGICLADGNNKLTMEDGSICNNFAGVNGGGIYVADEFKLLNGSINNNIANKNGGGIYLGWNADVTTPAQKLLTSTFQVVKFIAIKLSLELAFTIM